MDTTLIPGGDRREEVWTRERCYILEILNDPRVPEVSLAEARVEAGCTTELHRLSVAEYYIIRQGHGLMEVGGEPPFEVVPGDTVAIPAGTAQRISNRGGDDLVFQCLCLPRFTAASYEALE